MEKMDETEHVQENIQLKNKLTKLQEELTSVKKENSKLKEKLMANNLVFVSLRSTVMKASKSSKDDFERMLDSLKNISDSDVDNLTPEKGVFPVKKTRTLYSKVNNGASSSSVAVNKNSARPKLSRAVKGKSDLCVVPRLIDCSSSDEEMNSENTDNSTSNKIGSENATLDNNRFDTSTPNKNDIPASNLNVSTESSISVVVTETKTITQSTSKTKSKLIDMSSNDEDEDITVKEKDLKASIESKKDKSNDKENAHKRPKIDTNMNPVVVLHPIRRGEIVKVWNKSRTRLGYEIAVKSK